MSRIPIELPAFPVQTYNAYGNPQMHFLGMELRDFFASEAIQGLMGRNWG